MKDWKLLRPAGNQPRELYDLHVDGGETNDVAQTHPKRVRMMIAEYETWRERIGARQDASLRDSHNR